MYIDCMDYKVRHKDTHKAERKEVNKKWKDGEKSEGIKKKEQRNWKKTERV